MYDRRLCNSKENEDPRCIGQEGLCTKGVHGQLMKLSTLLEIVETVGDTRQSPLGNWMRPYGRSCQCLGA
jgi:hypothetical protein